MGPLYVDAAVNYGHAQFTTNRLVAIPGLTERATGEFGGNPGRRPLRSRLACSRAARFELTPFAGVSVQALRQAAYDENSIDVTTNRAGSRACPMTAQTSTSVRSFLGAQAAATFVIGERASVTPRVRLAWCARVSHPPDRSTRRSCRSREPPSPSGARGRCAMR
jgi:uncharacterized protein with beta-barrel porin domain